MIQYQTKRKKDVVNIEEYTFKNKIIFLLEITNYHKINIY